MDQGFSVIPQTNFFFTNLPMPYFPSWMRERERFEGGTRVNFRAPLDEPLGDENFRIGDVEKVNILAYMSKIQAFSLTNQNFVRLLI